MKPLLFTSSKFIFPLFVGLMIFSCKTEYITPDDEHAKDLNLTINDLPAQLSPCMMLVDGELKQMVGRYSLNTVTSSYSISMYESGYVDLANAELDRLLIKIPVQSNEIEESTILLIDALDAVYSVGVDDFIETTYILDPDMTSTITYKIDEQGRLEGRGTIHLSEGFGSNEPIKRVISDLRFSIELYEL